MPATGAAGSNVGTNTSPACSRRRRSWRNGKRDDGV